MAQGGNKFRRNGLFMRIYLAALHSLSSRLVSYKVSIALLNCLSLLSTYLSPFGGGYFDVNDGVMAVPVGTLDTLSYFFKLADVRQVFGRGSDVGGKRWEAGGVGWEEEQEWRVLARAKHFTNPIAKA